MTTECFSNASGGPWKAAAIPCAPPTASRPASPRSTQPLVITARVTDPQGVTSVVLAYQIVTPGSFIPAFLPLTTAQLNSINTVPLTNSLNPQFELAANWTTVVMRDDGLGGDAVAGDDIYTATIPAQANRTLVRYRITSADALGLSRRAPFEDDPSLNFAAFVYDGVPDYLGFSAASLTNLPVFTMVTRDADLQQCAAWFTAAMANCWRV